MGQMVSNGFPPVFPQILMMTGQRLDAEAARRAQCFLSHLDDSNSNFCLSERVLHEAHAELIVRGRGHANKASVSVMLINLPAEPFATDVE